MPPSIRRPPVTRAPGPTVRSTQASCAGVGNRCGPCLFSITGPESASATLLAEALIELVHEVVAVHALGCLVLVLHNASKAAPLGHPLRSLVPRRGRQ